MAFYRKKNNISKIFSEDIFRIYVKIGMKTKKKTFMFNGF